MYMHISRVSRCWNHMSHFAHWTLTTPIKRGMIWVVFRDAWEICSERSEALVDYNPLSLQTGLCWCPGCPGTAEGAALNDGSMTGQKIEEGWWRSPRWSSGNFLVKVWNFILWFVSWVFMLHFKNVPQYFKLVNTFPWWRMAGFGLQQSLTHHPGWMQKGFHGMLSRDKDPDWGRLVDGCIQLYDQVYVFVSYIGILAMKSSFKKPVPLGDIFSGSMNWESQLRVIPTMAFNSSHFTFCLANLLAFHLAFYLTFNLAYLSGISSRILSVISSDIQSGISFWHYSSDIQSGILSGISSDILSGISIWHIFSHSIWLVFWHSIWHSIWLVFWHSIWHIFWHSLWHIFWHSICHIFWHSIWHFFLALHLECLLTFYLAYLLTFYLAYLLTFNLAYLLTFYLAFSLAFYMALFLPVEVRRGPLRSRAGRWGPARPTAIKSWQMTSGEAHCDQELADEVRRGPLRSRAGRWGRAKITAIKSWQMRSGEEGGTTSRSSRASDIKSNNPHLAGGEKRVLPEHCKPGLSGIL